MTATLATLRPVPVPVPVRPSCALCTLPPASVFGLCALCLAQAAAEHARLTPAIPSQADRSPASVPFRALCGRCGRPGHVPEDCDA